jgi:membrane dipeptidase
MKRTIVVLTTLTISFISFSQSAEKLHRKAVLVDTHNDVLSEAVLNGVDISNEVTSGHSDLVRWKKGGLDVQFFSVWTGERPRTKEGFFHDAQQEIDSLYALIQRNPERMVLARNYGEVKKGIKKGQLVSLIGVEGGHMIEHDMDRLQSLYNRGMRYMTLTWNNSTDWATSAMDETGASKENPLTADPARKKGLTDFGKAVVRKMNELGIIVDLSHTGEQTFYDAIATTTKPVLLSHSSVWNLCPVFRNVKDDQIRAVAKNGGVICINFYSGFINRDYEEKGNYFMSGAGRQSIDDSIAINHPEANGDSVLTRNLRRQYYRQLMKPYQPTVAQLVDHIEYIIKLVGDDYVGIGSDFDGVSSLPAGIRDVTDYPVITRELLRRGYSRKTIRKVLGANVMRVMRANFL